MKVLNKWLSMEKAKEEGVEKTKEILKDDAGNEVSVWKGKDGEYMNLGSGLKQIEREPGDISTFGGSVSPPNLEKQEATEVATKAVGKTQEQISSGATAALKMDELDEEMITEKYDGVEPLYYFIKTSKGDKKILSWKGLTECSRRQGNLEVLVVDFDTVDGKVIAKAKAKDLKNNVTMVGTAERAKAGDFYLTVLSSKAIRNALKKLISPKIETEVIKEAEAKDWGVEIKPYNG